MGEPISSFAAWDKWINDPLLCNLRLPFCNYYFYACVEWMICA